MRRFLFCAALAAVFASVQSRNLLQAPAPAPGPAPTPAPGPALPVVEAPAAPAGLTLAQVATHSSESDCWAAINGKVYDLTAWLPQHPGGVAILAAHCGQDASAPFNMQHGGDPEPQERLPQYLLGDLSA
ncbi:hypothetical protein ABPG77_000283 [Micractinium sp. CCAP 211/92]